MTYASLPRCADPRLAGRPRFILGGGSNIDAGG